MQNYFFYILCLYETFRSDSKKRRLLILNKSFTILIPILHMNVWDLVLSSWSSHSIPSNSIPPNFKCVRRIRIRSGPPCQKSSEYNDHSEVLKKEQSSTYGISICTTVDNCLKLAYITTALSSDNYLCQFQKTEIWFLISIFLLRFCLSIDLYFCSFVHLHFCTIVLFLNLCVQNLFDSLVCSLIHFW